MLHEASSLFRKPVPTVAVPTPCSPGAALCGPDRPASLYIPEVNAHP